MSCSKYICESLFGVINSPWDTLSENPDKWSPEPSQKPFSLLTITFVENCFRESFFFHFLQIKEDEEILILQDSTFLSHLFGWLLDFLSSFVVFLDSNEQFANIIYKCKLATPWQMPTWWIFMPTSFLPTLPLVPSTTRSTTRSRLKSISYFPRQNGYEQEN